MSNPEFFLARQPIVDRSRQLVAYELLFRAGNVGHAEVTSDIAATATVIRNAFMELGLSEALGEHQGFINVSADLLLSDLMDLMPKDQIVIELLETIDITPEIVERCRELALAGYTLALDDCIELDPPRRALLPYIKIIKIDLMALTSEQQLIDVARQMRHLPVKKLAEKVDSAEQFELCLSLGFDYFQGYFFAKPSLMRGKQSTQENDPMLLKLLGLVAQDAETEELERAFKQAPHMTVNLLRLVNSVAAGAPRKLSSVRDALMVLGRAKLKRWVQLLVFAAGNQAGSGSSNALLEVAAVRGRMMEIMAQQRYAKDRELPDKAFMTGMLSVVDALLDKPLSEILQATGVSAEINEALLQGTGVLGGFLDEVIETEVGIGTPELTNIQIEALRWVQDTRKDI